MLAVLSGLDSPHPDRIVENLDVVEAIGSEPAEDLWVEKLPLVRGGVPVERVEPAPLPVWMARHRTHEPQSMAEDGHSVEVVERDRRHREDAHHRQRKARGDRSDGIGKADRNPVTGVEVYG